MAREHLGTGAFETGLFTRRDFLKGVSLLISSSVGGMVLAGCQGSVPATQAPTGGASTAVPAAAAAAKEVQLRFLTTETSPAAVDFFKKSFDSFKTKNPGTTVSPEHLGYADLRKRLGELISANQMPDLMYVDDTGIASLALNDMLTPLTDLVKELGDILDIHRFIYRSEDVFVPGDMNFWMTWYRTDLYQEAGLEPPKYSDDYVEKAKRLTIPSKQQYGSIVVANPATGPVNAHHMCSVFWSHGAKFWQKVGNKWEPALDQEPYKSAAKRALEYYKALAASSPNTSNFDWGAISSTFASGKVATCDYIGARTYDVVRTTAADLLPKIRAVPFPYPQDKKFMGSNGISGYIVPKASKNINLAKELTRYLMTGDTYLNELKTVPMHLIPSRQSVYKSDGWRGQDAFKQNPYVLDILDKEFQSSYNPMREPGQDEVNPYAGMVFDTTTYGTLLRRVIDGEDISKMLDWTVSEMKKLRDSV